jgi:hypothetical protein
MLSSRKNKLIAILITFFSGFMLFYNLGDRPLWGDEAETALLAYNINNFGVPTAYDGKNYITLRGAGIDTNSDNIWTWTPWIDEYITAGSFSIFGKTATAARLPFAIISLLSVLLLALLINKVFKNNEVTLVVLLFYITNVTFILHSRQCRYYSLVFLSQIWLIYGFYQLLKNKGLYGIINTFIPLAIQFYSNYMLVVPNLITLLFFSLLFFRRYGFQLLRNIIFSFSFFVLSVLPWLLYAKPWQQTGDLSFQYFTSNLMYYLTEINFHIIPFIIFVIQPVFFLSGKLLKQEPEKNEFSGNLIAGNVNNEIYSPDADSAYILKFLWLQIPFVLLLLALTQWQFNRYLIILVPALIILSVVIIIRYLKNRIIRYILVSMLCLTNVFSVISLPLESRHNFEFPILKYALELTSKYNDKLTDIIGFLKKEGSPEQSVYTPDPDFPLIFYTDMKIVDIRLNQNIDVNNLPDWILSESASGLFPMKNEIVPPKEIMNLYEMIILKVHKNSNFDNLPDPDTHTSFTSKEYREFKIYRKREP